MGRLTTIIFFVSQLCIAQETVLGPEGDCGFSKFHPLRISHYVENDATARVTPQYPPAAKANGTTGTVRVQVLVNEQGLVERTCPEFVKGQARPDRSLVVAAEAAALQWSFSPNFGLQSESRAGPLKYAWGVLIFNFVLDEPKKEPLKRD
jgi:TonB family protein